MGRRGEAQTLGFDGEQACQLPAPSLQLPPSPFERERLSPLVPRCPYEEQGQSPRRRLRR